MTLPATSREKVGVHAVSIVAYAQPQHSRVIADLDFYPVRSGVPECVPHGLTRNSVKIIPQKWVHLARRALHQNAERGRRVAGAGIDVCPELSPQSSKSVDKVVAAGPAAAQFLDSIPALGDRLGSAIDGNFEGLLSLDGSFGEHVVNGLKAKHQSMKTLQQGIVQLPRDAGSFGETLLKAEVQLPG